MRTRQLLLVIFLLLLCRPSIIKGQYYEIGGSLGFSTYQGDISPLGWRFSVEGAHLAKGIHVGYHVNELLSFKLRYYETWLAADDAGALSRWRRDRNLSFKTDISEVSLIAEIEMLDMFSFFRKFRLKPFCNFGLGVFKFNPVAKYKGFWYELQPLGTEGQGLADTRREPYKLTQLSIPFGVGLRYEVSEDFIISFEISPRWTFTDYLDDVSQSYPDLDLLRSERGEIAAGLSYRSVELTHIDLETPQIPGRGNPKENDWYFITSVSFTYKFDPALTISKKHKYAGYYKCPFRF